jgi:hypothetical protein
MTGVACVARICGHTNILKRVLIHAGGFNLGLVMRHLFGIGTPRGLQGRVAAVVALLWALMGVRHRLRVHSSSHRLFTAVRDWLWSRTTSAVNLSAAATGDAVGTPVTRRPPHRTVRAGLLHTAPTLDA